MNTHLLTTLRKSGQSTDLAERLACEHEWFADLKREGDRAHLLMPTELDGVTVRVRELTGSAGDGWLMHPWLLQGKAPPPATGCVT